MADRSSFSQRFFSDAFSPLDLAGRPEKRCKTLTILTTCALDPPSAGGECGGRCIIPAVLLLGCGGTDMGRRGGCCLGRLSGRGHAVPRLAPASVGAVDAAGCGAADMGSAPI